MGRFGRSWQLMKQSYRVLMQDKELLVLPLLSGIAILVVCASFIFGMGLTDDDALQKDEIAYLLPTLLFYIVTYTIAIFFQAAVIAGANERMSGGNPTLGSALGAAGRRFGSILVWGIVAGTVGMVIRAVQERSDVAGKIIMGLIGVVWSLATYFMVPIIVMERLPLGASFKKSWAIFKQTWGETVIANVGLGLVAFVFYIPVIVVCGLLWQAGLVTIAIIVAVLGVGLLSTFFAALQGVFVTSLYRYATQGDVPAGMDRELIANAFRKKGG